MKPPAMSPLPAEPVPPSAPPSAPTGDSARWKMWLVLAICAAPVLASYALYFLVRPEGRVNYGELLEPQRDLPDTNLPGMSLRTGDGVPVQWSAWRGKWILLTIHPASCASDCVQRLYAMRQVRLTTGRDQDRIERVWLIPDGEPSPSGLPDAALLAEHPGLHVLHLRPEALESAFPPALVEAGQKPLNAGVGHIFVVDPLGHVMMRFPLNADPNRMKKDIARLLRASRVG